MRSLVLIPLLSAVLAVNADYNKINTAFYFDRDNVNIPFFTQEQLEKPAIVPIDIANAKHQATFKWRKFEDEKGELTREVLQAPHESLFKTIHYNGVPIYQPAKFFTYKIVIDYVSGEPTFLRLEGVISRSVYAHRYFIMKDGRFSMVSRPEFVRARTRKGVAYTLDLNATDEELKEHSMNCRSEGRSQNINIYYPKYNHYIEEVVAGSRSIWSFNPLSAEVCLKVLTYVYEGKKFLIIRTMDWLGEVEESMYLETADGYTHVGHTPTIRDDTVSRGVVNMKEPEIKPVLVALSTDASRELYRTAKLIQVNFRKEPRANERWNRVVNVTSNANTETVFTPHYNTLIYRLTDGRRLVWDRPGLAIMQGSHLLTVEGREILQLTVVNDEGVIYEYFLEKSTHYWKPVMKADVVQQTRPEVISDLFGEHVYLDPKEVAPEESDYLRGCKLVDLDISQYVNPAWHADHVKVGSFVVRRVFTATEGFAFKRVVLGEKVILDPQGRYLSRKAIHYRVNGMELFGFLAVDKADRTAAVHYRLGRDGVWMPLEEKLFNRLFLQIVLDVNNKVLASSDIIEGVGEGSSRTAVTQLSEAPAAEGEEKQEGDQQDLYPLVNLPVEDQLDTHVGGHKLDRAANEAVLQLASTCQDIRLELKGRQDEHYNIHAISSKDKTVRIVYTPSDGYLFNEVTESNVMVFNTPDFKITEATIDEVPDGQYFLQLIAFDKEGYQHMFYFYKRNKYHNFKEVSRATYTTLRFRSSMTHVAFDIGKSKKANNSVIRLQSKHYDNVDAFVPRYNCIISEVSHGDFPIWRFDELNPEVVSRMVVFKRENINGVLLQLIDAQANEHERLYLNANPKTNEYVLFVHKGEMFSLFKEYLVNRMTGPPGFRKYRPNDIDWSEVIEEGSESYEKIKTPVVDENAPKGVAPFNPDAVEEPLADISEDDGGNAANGSQSEELGGLMKADGSAEEEEKEEASEEEKEEEPEEELTEEEIAKRAEEEAAKAAKLAAIEAKKKRQADVADSSYYVSIPFTVRKVVHKEGVVWEAGDSGDVCLDFKKYSKGQYRLVECEIMTPDGRVEIRYFMNTHNGRGHYKEVQICNIGQEI
ncbi:spherical body protein 3 [Babesia caballi]|uniref:Spherical body protein 3 n=1 Tax=Babesia caballi TaxID=5871 RepID=A0AAV4M0V4_BABCB|nr:spherical body protein 3 [Babesia caballi]